MQNGLKLYVWEGVLTDYTSGIAFALASSVEQAVLLVKLSGMEYEWHWEGNKLDGVEPKVYDTPIGFHLYGGG